MILRSCDISLSEFWVTPPMPELPEVRSSLWRLLVRFPPALTGELFLGDLSLRGELCRLLPIPLLPFIPEFWLHWEPLGEML